MTGRRYERSFSRELELSWPLMRAIHEHVSQRAEVNCSATARLSNGDELNDTSPDGLRENADRPVDEVTLAYSPPGFAAFKERLSIIITWGTTAHLGDNGFTPGMRALVGSPNDTEVLGLKAGLEELIDGHVDEPIVEGPPTETDAPDTDVLRVEVETPSRWYQRLIDHPWFITIVGGIIVLVLGILIFGN